MSQGFWKSLSLKNRKLGEMGCPWSSSVCTSAPFFSDPSPLERESHFQRRHWACSSNDGASNIEKMSLPLASDWGEGGQEVTEAAVRSEHIARL